MRNYISVISMFLLNLISTNADSCDGIRCSNVYDPVCGQTTAPDGYDVFKRFQNICHLEKMQCKKFLDLHQVHDKKCNIDKKASFIIGRRVYDFSVVGAHQACNHTCPTFCLDTYEPACAQIWSQDMQRYTYRPMINHCHIDLYSCVMGVNVTIQPLIGKCYKNPTALMFMFHIASLKTLKLLDEPPATTYNNLALPVVPKRRFNTFIEDEETRDFVQLLMDAA